MALDQRHHLMGAANVKAVYALWSGRVKQPELLALVYMAAVSIDPQNGASGRPPRVFWEGREALAVGIGHPVPPPPDPGSPPDVRDKINKQRRASFVMVERAVRGLIAAGAIERVSDGRRGGRSEYVLNLDSP